MRILVAEDDVTSRMLLEHTLKKWGYEVVSTNNGLAAWEALQVEYPPKVVILDWMMPEMDGHEICRRLRASERLRTTYVILLTARITREDLVDGLTAGADDYITKPFNNEELHARLKVGLRIVELQATLEDRVEKLQEAIDHIKTLKGIIPICSYCKKIRDDQNYWQQVESYISRHSDAEFSHGVCPDCYQEHVKPQLDEIRKTATEPA
ncbi:MAG: response regulator [Candidatus Neomarinimicrobiota bacterium]